MFPADFLPSACNVCSSGAVVCIVYACFWEQQDLTHFKAWKGLQREKHVRVDTVGSLFWVNFQEHQPYWGGPICVNCQRIWDTSLQSVSFSPRPLDEESAEENTPCSFLRGGDTPAKTRWHSSLLICPLTPSYPGILIYLSAWLWGLLGSFPQYMSF